MSSPVRPNRSPEKAGTSSQRSNSVKKLQRFFRSPKQSESGGSSPETKSPSFKPKRRKSVNVDPAKLESGSPHTPTSSPPRPSPYQLGVASKEKSSRLLRSFSSPRAPQMKKLASPPRTPTRFGPVTTISAASASLSAAATLVAQSHTSPEARPVGSPVSRRSPATPGSPDSPSRMRVNSSPGRLEDESWRRIARRVSENIMAELLKTKEQQIDQPRHELEQPDPLASNPSNSSNSSNNSNSANTAHTTGATLMRTTSDVSDTPSPTQSPTVLRKRRRSNDFEREHNITRKPAPLAYPPLASPWINQQSFERLDRPAQLVIHAFSAARMLHETGKATFGDQWSFPFGADAPMRTWAQAGIVERTDKVQVRYLKGVQHFESHFSKGTLQLHFAEEMERIKPMPPGKVRNQAILNLAKQADHVVNFSSEMIRRITLRADVKTAEEVMAAWSAMSAETPSEYQKGVMRAYFGEKECIAIQAFNNAFFWLLDKSGDCYEPKQSREVLVKTFYGLTTQFLGFVFSELQVVLAKQLTEQYRTVLARIGVGNEELAAALSAYKKKNEGPESAEKIEKNIEKHEEAELRAAFQPLWSPSLALIKILSQGDTRFLDLYGLTITDPPASTSVIESVSPALPDNTAFPDPPSTTSLPALPATPSQQDQ